MDGHSQNKKRKKVRDWLAKCLIEGSWKIGDDLHIDEIDKTYKNKTLWLTKGIEILKLAENELKNEDYIIDLVFSLSTTNIYTGVNFKNKSELQSEFDWSPPSLFLYSKDRWNREISTLTPVNIPDLELGDNYGIRYWVKKSEHSNEFYRSIFIFRNVPK